MMDPLLWTIAPQPLDRKVDSVALDKLGPQGQFSVGASTKLIRTK